MTTQRYEVSKAFDADEAIVWDTEEHKPVYTEGGRIYEAPVANAEWVADRLNETDFRHTVDDAYAAAARLHQRSHEADPEP